MRVASQIIWVGRMNYQDFINDILNRRGRFNCGDQYHERHHIKPKCMGGTNDKENLIDLFAQEHFIAHKLLAEENPHNIKLTEAYNIMAFVKNKHQQRYQITPEEYEEARKMVSNSRKELYKNKANHPSYGKHLSDETKQKISKANKNNKYCVGRIMSEETRKKISRANKNPSAETRKKMSEAQKRRHLEGENNPRARKVRRISDGKVYGCIKEAALDNNINYSTLKSRLSKGTKDFEFCDTQI